MHSRPRFFVTLAALILSVTAGLVYASGPAQAADPIFTYQNQITNRCMDDTSQGFRTWPCNDTNPQRWIVHAWADGTYRFQNVNTGRCIDDSSQGFRTWPCNSGQNQSWFVTVFKGNERQFQNQATGRCITDEPFTVTACTASDYQRWRRF